MTTRELAAQLAAFDQYPPEANYRDGQCAVCSLPVPARQGVVALGSDERGTFAVTLHRSCASEADAAR